MFIHKYTVGDDTFYRVSGKKAGPSKIVTLSMDEWKGVSAGANVMNAVKFLNSLKFSKDVMENPKEEKEEARKASLSSMIRSVIQRSA